MRQSDVKKLEAVISELNLLKSSVSPNNKIQNIANSINFNIAKNKEDIKKLRDVIFNMYCFGDSDIEGKIGSVRDTIETIKDYYEDKLFDIDYDSKFYDYYDNINDALEDALDEIDNIESANDDNDIYNEICDKLDDIIDAYDDMEFAMGGSNASGLENLGGAYEISSSINSAISSIQRAMAEIHG